MLSALERYLDNLDAGLQLERESMGTDYSRAITQETLKKKMPFGEKPHLLSPEQ